MPSLRELQTRVMDALLAGTPQAAASLSVPTGNEALSRLEIYRGTARANFADALHSTYPALWRLVGEDYFRQTAREFQCLRPSRSGDLRHAGGGFPEYLAQLHGDGAFRYLADVARLEWLIQESLLAADHVPLDLESLAGVPPAAYDRLCFTTHPTLHLFESPYPALRIWQVNVGSDAEPPVIELDSGGDRLALMRRRLQLEIMPLSSGEQAFLGSLLRGDHFADAVDRAVHADPEFDATAALQRFVAAEAIVDFRTPGGR